MNCLVSGGYFTTHRGIKTVRKKLGFILNENQKAN